MYVFVYVRVVQAKKSDNKYKGSIIDIYLRRLKNISFGFADSGFFVSQSGERPPWYLNPNLTFPAMILFVIVTFSAVISAGGIKEKGTKMTDIDISSIYRIQDNNNNDLMRM